MNKKKKKYISNSQEKNIILGLCILFFERVEQTIECIKSFLSSDVNIYILNNGSSDKSRKELDTFCKKYNQVFFFDIDKNIGIAAGRNYLITHTVEEWLLFVDNDIKIETKNWLQKFNFQVSLHKDIEVFIPRLYNKRTRNYATKKTIKLDGNRAILDTCKILEGETNCFPGGASFVNRNLFERLGLYDKQMFVGLEDYELSIRGILQRKPVKAQIIRDIVFIHNHQLLRKKEDRDAVSVRYNIDHISKSLNRIIEKHNVLLEGDWILSSDKAKNRLLYKNKESLKYRLKKRIPVKVKNLIKKVFLINIRNH